MKTEPLKLVCFCGFKSVDPHAFLDHCLTTQHVEMPAGAEDGALDALLKAFGTIQRVSADDDPEGTTLPDWMEIRRISRDDILADDELSEMQKAEILARLEAIPPDSED